MEGMADGGAPRTRVRRALISVSDKSGVAEFAGSSVAAGRSRTSRYQREVSSIHERSHAFSVVS